MRVTESAENRNEICVMCRPTPWFLKRRIGDCCSGRFSLHCPDEVLQKEKNKGRANREYVLVL